MRRHEDCLIVDMRLWIAFYRNPPRLVNKEGTDTYHASWGNTYELRRKIIEKIDAGNFNKN